MGLIVLMGFIGIMGLMGWIIYYAHYAHYAHYAYYAYLHSTHSTHLHPPTYSSSATPSSLCTSLPLYHPVQENYVSSTLSVRESLHHIDV